MRCDLKRGVDKHHFKMVSGVPLVPGVLLVLLVIPGPPSALEPSSAAGRAGCSTTSGGEVLQLWGTGEERGWGLRGGGPRDRSVVRGKGWC